MTCPLSFIVALAVSSKSSPNGVPAPRTLSWYWSNVSVSFIFIRLWFSHTQTTENKKGANLTHPFERHREAPDWRMLQSAPIGACLGRVSNFENSRFSRKTV